MKSSVVLRPVFSVRVEEKVIFFVFDKFWSRLLAYIDFELDVLRTSSGRLSRRLSGRLFGRPLDVFLDVN